MKRSALALAVVAAVAMLWLNQGPSMARWKAEGGGPLAFLYRRALDEEMYFATASAILGRPYDASAFGIRGQSPLPPVEVPADGALHAPYTEVPFEYPPPNVPVIVLPRLVAGTFEAYARVLGALMGLCLVVAAWLATKDADDRDRRLYAFALLLLAHGAIAIQRLDAIVALLLAIALRPGRWTTGIATGLLAGFKILPAAIPAVGTRGRGLLVAVAVAVLAVLPMPPSAIALLLRYHGARGLHVESALGTVYGTACALTGRRAAGVLDYGSFNFHGAVPDALAKLSPLLLLGLLALVFFRSAPAYAPLAATIALWLGGKVFSPQYLTWGLPLVVALPGKAWLKASATLGVVLLLSQLYLRGFFDHVYLQRPLGVATMAMRLVVLGGLFAWSLQRRAD